MARNHKFFFDKDGTPRARGPSAERVLMTFLEVDVQGSDHVCHDLMDDLVAIEDGSDEQREFVGNAHRVSIDREGVLIEPLAARRPDEVEGAAPNGTGPVEASPVEDGPAGTVPGGEAASGSPAPAALSGADDAASGTASYRTGLKHFREVLEDWEAFILDDELEDDSLLDDDFA